MTGKEHLEAQENEVLNSKYLTISMKIGTTVDIKTRYTNLIIHVSGFDDIDSYELYKAGGFEYSINNGKPNYIQDNFYLLLKEKFKKIFRPSEVNVLQQKDGIVLVGKIHKSNLKDILPIELLDETYIIEYSNNLKTIIIRLIDVDININFDEFSFEKWEEV